MSVNWYGHTFAEPWSPSGRDAIAHLERAQESVKAKQVEVRKAERGERVRFERAEICKPFIPSIPKSLPIP